MVNADRQNAGIALCPLRLATEVTENEYGQQGRKRQSPH